MNDWEKPNRDRFNKYVMNDIPIRLIRLSDMTFVERNDVRAHYQSTVDTADTTFYPLKSIVKYAILSHRWLDKGEPTYEEVKLGKAGGLGYGKLRKFCEMASEYGVEFAWSDTCCIDKRSSTELDESIRSMFRWYRNSTICIVHLAQSQTIEDMVGDAWMKRGWTLQELLAPRVLKFFNMHWMPMTGDSNDRGDKDSEVVKTLAKATGISTLNLTWFTPGAYNVDERMAWASNRETTRVEDVAYSLMGIFDVSLQIAYGEGGDRAFRRLFEAIIEGGDHSVFNWTGTPAEHRLSRAIPRSPHNFQGRTLGFRESPDRRTLDMTMTSRGLRVPLVIFPLHVTSTITSDWIDHVTAECLMCPMIKFDFDFNTFMVKDVPQFAVGIVNYWITYGDDPQILNGSAGIILHREHMMIPPGISVSQPMAGEFVGLRTVPIPEKIFGSWKKVDGQPLVKLDFPNLPSTGQSFFYVSREYLEIVCL
jgi:hypothetical protein